MQRDPSCPFCGIVTGDKSAHIVYESDLTVAFLDINPLVRGHTLVVPRAHHERLADLEAEEAAAFGRGITAVTGAVETAVGADGTTVGINNGSAAGQVVPHVHCHIIPRDRDDAGRNLHAVLDGHVSLEPHEFDAIAADIRRAGPG